MNQPLFKDKVTRIFVAVDDFCLNFEKPVQQALLDEDSSVKRRNRKAGLCDSEVISILISFHSGGFANFKFFYTQICLCASKRRVSETGFLQPVYRIKPSLRSGISAVYSLLLQG